MNCSTAASAILALSLSVAAGPAHPVAAQQTAANGDPLVSLAGVDSTIIIEARYHGPHNFMGRPVEGYEAPKCLLTRPAARALAAVQAELRAFGLSLKTYDCYRPQRAVDHFVRWAADPADTVARQEFYPTVPKDRLFSEGYIAQRSGHSRGSTVDLTIVPLPPATQPHWKPEAQVPCTAPAGTRFADNSLDMGTGYDCFDELSHTENGATGAEARRNRLLLRSVMEKHGFRNYPQEWWHFTLVGEPFPDTWFDIVVR